MKTLLEQLRDVAISRINESWWNAVTPPRAAQELAGKAFIEDWDRDSLEAKVVLRYCSLINALGYVPESEPGVAVSEQNLRLWRKVGPDVTGAINWTVARDLTPETADFWLQIFQKDEPTHEFVISSKRPRGKKGFKVMKGPGVDY
jgi:hypothetical protein